MSLPTFIPPQVVFAAVQILNTFPADHSRIRLPEYFELILYDPAGVFYRSQRLTLFEFDVKVRSKDVPWSSRVLAFGIRYCWFESGGYVCAEKVFDLKGKAQKSRNASATGNEPATASRTARNLRLGRSRSSRSRYPTSKRSASSTVRPNETRTAKAHAAFWTYSGSTKVYSYTPLAGTVWTKYSRTWTGSRTPRFGSLRKGQLPVNAHSVSLQTTSIGPMVFDEENKISHDTDGRLTTVLWFWSGASVPTHNAKAESIALSRLIQNASIAGQNLALDIVEIDQTMDMVVGNIHRIVRAVKAVKRGNPRQAAKELFRNHNPRYRRKGGVSPTKSLSQNWLELQYGWKPLIQDVFWAMDALSKKNFSERVVTRTTASASMKSTVTSTLIHPSFTLPAGTRVVNSRTSCKFGLDWVLDSRAVSLLAQAGFMNPIDLAWEILPFSFVVDWFLPLGPYFEQLSAWCGLSFSRGYKTKFTRQFTDLAADWDFYGTGSNWRQRGQGSLNDEWILLNRTKLTSFPSSTLPSFKSPISSLHVANALALLVSVFK